MKCGCIRQAAGKSSFPRVNMCVFTPDTQCNVPPSLHGWWPGFIVCVCKSHQEFGSDVSLRTPAGGWDRFEQSPLLIPLDIMLINLISKPRKLPKLKKAALPRGELDD